MLEVAHLTGLESTRLDLVGPFRRPRSGRPARPPHHQRHEPRLEQHRYQEREALQSGRRTPKRLPSFWDKQPPLDRGQSCVSQSAATCGSRMSARRGDSMRTASASAPAFGDLDGDGDLDLVVNNLDDMVSVYRNNGTSGHAIKLRLQGTTSNRWGIGATVRIRAGRPVASRLSHAFARLHVGQRTGRSLWSGRRGGDRRARYRVAQRPEAIVHQSAGRPLLHDYGTSRSERAASTGEGERGETQ